jgi:hypothetical protein
MEQKLSKLTPRERAAVVAVSVGSLVVLSFVAYLSVVYWFPAPLVRGIWDEVSHRRLKSQRAVWLAMALVYYVAIQPVLIIASVVSAFDGAIGKRTRLTQWILREVSHEQVRKRYDEELADSPDGVSPLDRIQNVFLPSWLGWAVFLGIVVAGAALLAWSAMHE